MSFHWMPEMQAVETFQRKAGRSMDWYPSLIVTFRVNFLWVRWRRADFLFKQAETDGRARSTYMTDRIRSENLRKLWAEGSRLWRRTSKSTKRDKDWPRSTFTSNMRAWSNAKLLSMAIRGACDAFHHSFHAVEGSVDLLHDP